MRRCALAFVASLLMAATDAAGPSNAEAVQKLERANLRAQLELTWKVNVIQDGVRSGNWTILDGWEAGYRILKPIDRDAGRELSELKLTRNDGAGGFEVLDRWGANMRVTHRVNSVELRMERIEITGIRVISEDAVSVEFRCIWQADGRLWKYFEQPKEACYGEQRMQRYTDGYRVM